MFIHRSPSDKGSVRLVVPAPGACQAHALNLLRQRNFKADEVVAVCAEGTEDVILWVDAGSVAHTTFARREKAADGKERTILSPALHGFLAP